ncbi:PLDc N-terminal domain-containing protein [Streptomyces olivoreticuli]
MLRYLPSLLVLGLWIYAFIDCLNTPEDEVRGLPKIGWVIVILLFGGVLVGPVAWVIAGRRRGVERPRTGGREGGQRWVAPDDNPEFLRSLRRDDQNGSGTQG